jgi:putative ABC transport system substrate-binding protein
VKRKILICLLATILLATVSFVEAQQHKVYRIGFLSGGAPPESNIAAFRQGMRELGYVEGQNLLFEFRWAGGKRDQYPKLATELLALPVDVIVAFGSEAAHGAKNATNTIPIVMESGDPVTVGLIASLARPGGNITGLTTMVGELGGKYLELLKETAPKVSRVAIPTPDSETAKFFLKESAAPARALGLHLIPLWIRVPVDFESVLQAVLKEHANGLLSRIGPTATPGQRRRLIEFANKNRLPAIYESTADAAAGGLIVYGADRDDIWRRFATYVDKILKGAKPADLPVEQPTKFEFIVNLKTAKQIGLTIPPNVLARADKVIR